MVLSFRSASLQARLFYGSEDPDYIKSISLELRYARFWQDSHLHS